MAITRRFVAALGPSLSRICRVADGSGRLDAYGGVRAALRALPGVAVITSCDGARAPHGHSHAHVVRKRVFYFLTDYYLGEGGVNRREHQGFFFCNYIWQVPRCWQA